MGVPDFLRPENVRYNPEDHEMVNLIRRYREEIGDDLITEPSSFTTQEWINMLNECIEKRITIWELLGEKYDPDAYY
ncbi:MAG: hypothetical protein Q4E24_13990 [bacterium]|nr:hypothetical protein [bacterium]